MDTHLDSRTETSSTPLPEVIGAFRDQHRFLSNMFPGAVTIEGQRYATSEHAYQALKTDNPQHRRQIREAPDPGTAKRLGQRAPMRDQWEATLRYRVMHDVVTAKFADPLLRARLLDTGDALLIEGNHWHDQNWGDCSCPTHAPWPGRNHLGRILMDVRAAARGDSDQHWPRVSLTGHRPGVLSRDEETWARQALQDCLAAMVARHGTRACLSGFALGADTWWAQAALSQGVPLWAYIPSRDQAALWRDPADVDLWGRLRAAAAREVVLGEKYDVALLHERNRLLVRDGDLLVAVLHPAKAASGGTAGTVALARAMGRSIMLLNPADRTLTLEPGERYRLPAPPTQAALW